MSSSVLHDLFRKGHIQELTTLIEKNETYQNDIEALNLYATILFKNKNFEKAIEVISKAISISSENLVLLNNRAHFLIKNNEFDKSLNDLNKILKLMPKNDENLNNIGRVFLKKRQYLEAISYFDKAIKINPTKNYYFYNKAITLFKLTKYEDSIIYFNKSIELKPDHIKSYHNRGLAYQEILELDKALKDHDFVIQQTEDFFESHFAKSYIHLIRGEYELGWKFFEYRRNKINLIDDHPNLLKSKLWLGDNELKDKTILLFSEQGLGDTIQFSRYLKFFKPMGAKVTVQVQESLIELIKSIEPSFTYISEKNHDMFYEYHCPLMSLPLAFKTNLKNIPKEFPYLSISESKTEKWNKEMDLIKKHKIGLSWRGNPNNANDYKRSIKLEQIIDQLSDEYHWIFLNKNLEKEEENLINSPSITISDDKNFFDLACICENLDLIITVDTSIAHLAGALGKKVILLLPYYPDFRWLLEIKNSPWYPTIKIYRQDEKKDWKKTFKEAVDDLGNFLN